MGDKQDIRVTLALVELVVLVVSPHLSKLHKVQAEREFAVPDLWETDRPRHEPQDQPRVRFVSFHAVQE